MVPRGRPGFHGYTRPMIRGSLDRLHFGDLLQWLQMGSLSGRLTVRSSHGERRFDFQDGRLFFVSSTFADERLGSWLAQRGLASAPDLLQLLAMSMLRRAMFTDLLIDHGKLAADDLRRALTELAETLASRVLVTTGAEFSLDTEFPVRDILGFNLNVQPSRLLMEAARRTDEASRHLSGTVDRDLPVTGDAFEGLFWDLVRGGVTAAEPLAGDQLASLHDQIRDIVGALAQWLAHSPGLVPLPRGHAAGARDATSGSGRHALFGRPQAAWNQMVLSRCLHRPGHEGPEDLGELERAAADFDLWNELGRAEHLHRPDAPKLDDAVHEVVTRWSLTASAAAPHLGVPPDAATLAVHLVMVPTDLVLLVLATLPIPHKNLRTALLGRLPRRVGSCLGRLADFPGPIRQVLDPCEVTPLGVTLQIGRQELQIAGPWPRTVPEDAGNFNSIASPAALALASEAAAEAADSHDPYRN